MPYDKKLWVKTDKQIAAHRLELMAEQNGLDPILGEPLRSPCLDHDHFDGRCRGVVSQCVNTFEGQVLKAWMKYVSDYTDTSLSTALRNLADYLERDGSESKIHGKHMSEMTKTLKKWTKETIRRRAMEDLNLTIPEEADKTGAVKAYLIEFIQQTEEYSW